MSNVLWREYRSEKVPDNITLNEESSPKNKVCLRGWAETGDDLVTS